MMSVMAPAVHIPMHLDTVRSTQDVEFNEVCVHAPFHLAQCRPTLLSQLGNLDDAVEPFAQYVLGSLTPAVFRV